jgi:DNA-binding CsgD family transcriptional regulator
MHLNTDQMCALSQVMTILAEETDSRSLRTQLGRLMLELLGAQHYASYVWNAAENSFGSGIHINMSEASQRIYEAHYQFHDPITPALQKHRRAVRVTEVLPQADLKKTEFFNDFLIRDGLYWGVNLYAWSGGHNIGDMRIWRDRERGNFTVDDVDLLNLVRPAFVAALLRNHSNIFTPAVVGASGALACLSLREQQVARCVEAGYGDKYIAQRLGIAVTTVRSHVDSAFRKLDVNNRLSLVNKLQNLKQST